jgi:hypothetical protein
MLGRMLPDKLPEPEQIVGVLAALAVERIVVQVGHIVVQVALVVGMPVVLLPGSIVDRVLGPCMLSSRLCKSIYRSGCTRIRLASWGDRNTDLVMEPEQVRLR